LDMGGKNFSAAAQADIWQAKALADKRHFQ
jgi:hypothetical protein